MRSARIELILDTLKAVKGARDLSKATDELADNLGDTAREGDRAGRAIDDAGDEMSEAARAAAVLDHEIDKLSGSLREMAVSQALTGESFTKQIRQQEAEVRRLTKSRKLLNEESSRSGAGLKSGIENVLEGVAKNGGSILATMGPAAAPFIGAAIGAAVIGGAAGVGIIGGIMVAKNDARVQAAGTELGRQLTMGLQKDAAGFVEPMLKSVDLIGDRFQQLRPKIKSIFDNSSQFLEPLTDGATKGIAGLVKGIDVAVSRAGPLVDALAYSFQKLGEDTGQFFADVSKGAGGAALAIRDITDVTGGLLKVLGPVIGGLGQIYEVLSKIGLAKSAIESLAGPLGTVGKVLGDVQGKSDEASAALDRGAASGRRMGSGTFEAAGGIEEVKAQAAASTHSLAAMADALDRTTDANRSLYDSSISVQEAIQQVTEARKQNGKTLDFNTEKGLDNARALSTLAKALNRQYDAAVAVNGVGPQTDAVAAGNRASFIRLATSLTGSATQARRLTDQILGIPKKADTRIGTPGLPQADAGIKNYGRKLDGLARSIKTSVTVTGDAAAYGRLQKLLVAQQALKKGIPISAAQSAFNKNAFYGGGYTGHGSKYQEAGVVHAGEYVFSAEATSALGVNRLDQMHKKAKAPGYAVGGLVAPFRVNAAITRIPSMAEAMAAVMPAFGDWPSSPSAQRGDSGVWRRIVAMIRATGPMSGSFGNAYRAGDPLWHGSGRAVDWMGFGQDRLATFLANKRPLELIHRTNNRDYAYTRGVNKGSFNESLMNAHRNHVHIAMANGGMIREPVLGVGRSGATYSFAERGAERVLSTAQTAAGGAGGGVTIVLSPNFYGPVGSPYELRQWLTGEVDNLKRLGRI